MNRPTRPDDGSAFIPDMSGRIEPVGANDADAFGKEFVASATSCEPVYEDAHDEVVDDEEGGPFIVLDDNARLPAEPQERRPESDGHEPVREAETSRAARWASRGR